jgi:hypothetical protein
MNTGIVILLLIMLALLRWFRKAGTLGKIFIALAILLFIATGLLAFLGLVSNNFDLQTTDADTDNNLKVEQLQDKRGNVILSSLRQWSSYNDDQYAGRLTIKKNDYDQARRFRNAMANKLNDDEQSWQAMYAQLAQNDAPKLDMICTMLDSIRQANQLNARDFAELIGTCIQDIPYYLILDGPCDPRYYDGEFIQDYLQKGNPCLGNVAFGLQSPAEFMGNLKGDCDTRTVLAHTLLSKFGYDAVVLVSLEYQHSILGINMPTRGAYKTHQGKRYYTWELTVPNMEIGQIDPEQGNMQLWKVYLSGND